MHEVAIEVPEIQLFSPSVLRLRALPALTECCHCELEPWVIIVINRQLNGDYLKFSIFENL